MSDEKNQNEDPQVERADAEAARAAAAAEEAAAAAEAAAGADEAAAAEAGAAAEEAKEAAAQAEEAAEAAAEAPKPKRARKAREAEVAADEAEEAAEEAVAAAKPKRSRTKKAAEPKADEAAEPKADEAAEPKADEAAVEAPAKPATAPRRKRDQRREAPVGVEVRAQAKYVRTSARKARLVCDHIRGKDVAEARAILAFTPRSVAKDWAKLLESAVANAEHNHELVGEELKVAAVYADEGPTLKRFRPRAMGRATRIRKRTSHLTITLTPKEL
jgi:ribosomal protein L22